jgi:hypothetical protein
VKDRIVIANASGFWGDEAAAVARQVRGGPIDYLTMDFLAEITMIILARQKSRSEEAGYARDFVSYLAPLLDEIAAGGITVIANAGGINPGACARALEFAAREAGVELPVAVVDGDDLMPRLAELAAAGETFAHLETGQPLGEELERVRAANAYLGARPIVAALDAGARIVVTGRTYDAASVLAPMVHEFGWDWQDWDKLAAGLLAGHLIECGAQATGGNYTRWREVADFREIGFPLAEVSPDGSFVLTKHPGTGGIVTTRTATEQLLYEIGDPRAYLSPDVAADFTSCRMVQEGPDRVRIDGVRGQAPPPSVKVSMCWDAGMRASGMVIVSGPDAVAKCGRFAEIFWGRVGDGFDETRTDLIGYDSCWGAATGIAVEPNEIALRFSARSNSAEAMQRFGRELAGIALSGPPGICGAGARPAPSPAFGFRPALVAREHVTARMFFDGRSHEFPMRSDAVQVVSTTEPGPEPDSVGQGPRVRVPLWRIAHARSGDKGDLCNIGVAALTPELYPELVREVTAERVAAWFATNVHGPVERYRLDNLCALNFVLRNALGGGGTVSLLVDAQGKTMSQGLLLMEVEVAADLLPAQEAR